MIFNAKQLNNLKIQTIWTYSASIRIIHHNTVFSLMIIVGFPPCPVGVQHRISIHPLKHVVLTLAMESYPNCLWSYNITDHQLLLHCKKKLPSFHFKKQKATIVHQNGSISGFCQLNPLFVSKRFKAFKRHLQ